MLSLDWGPGIPSAFEGAEKAECLAATQEIQLSSNPALDQAHLSDSKVESFLSIPSMVKMGHLKEVSWIIKSLKPRKSSGPDGIRNEELKLLPYQLIALLVCVFNVVMIHGHFPAAWKRATVIGIHKSGKKTNIPDSYRPISFLNTLGKVYERLLLSRLLKVVSEKKINRNELFGFRANINAQIKCFASRTSNVISRWANSKTLVTARDRFSSM